MKGKVSILAQPDDRTCGPTCLHALYGYYGDDLPLERVIAEVGDLVSGGTLAVFLACHALRRGYQARIYTYNLQVFDPTWFTGTNVDIADRLRQQARYKKDPKLSHATSGYLEFLQRGGVLRYTDLSRGLIRRYLKRGFPILTGLSATHLYGTAREIGETDEFDDVRGEPAGHFVVVSDYDKQQRSVLVNDPLFDNPMAAGGHYYRVDVDHLLNAILLGVITYDANLLVIGPSLPSVRRS